MNLWLFYTFGFFEYGCVKTVLKILIVEDEFIIALDLQMRLENLGYYVSGIALNGKEAIKQIGVKTPDLILMDLQLNGEMKGIDVAQQIYDHYNIPVIYITGSHDDSILDKAKQTYPIGFVNKPFYETEIQNLIETVLNGEDKKILL